MSIRRKKMRTVFRYLQPLLGDLATVVTLIFAWRACADVNTSSGQFVLVILTALILLLIGFSTVQEYRYSRKARYSEITGYLSDIYRDILKIAHDTNANAAHLQTGCENVVNNLASALSLVTATRCAACVKIIVQGQRPKLVTLCRDKGSSDRDTGDKVEHWIDANSDFEEVAKAVTTPRKSFFENDLPSRRDYNNTSFDVYGQPYQGRSVLADWRRNRQWPLPYKSTIVLPIARANLPASGVAQHELAGFLCIDSGARGAFSRRYDEELARGIAAALYHVVRRYTELAWERK
jgi:hypothetical protein